MDILKIAVALMNLYISPNFNNYPHCTYEDNWDYPQSMIFGVPAIRIKCESKTEWVETDLVPVLTLDGFSALPYSVSGFKL